MHKYETAKKNTYKILFYMTSKMSKTFWGIGIGNLHFAVAELSVLGASWRGVKRSALEDPVKNGASSNDC